MGSSLEACTKFTWAGPGTPSARWADAESCWVSPSGPKYSRLLLPSPPRLVERWSCRVGYLNEGGIRTHVSRLGRTPRSSPHAPDASAVIPNVATPRRPPTSRWIVVLRPHSSLVRGAVYLPGGLAGDLRQPAAPAAVRAEGVTLLTTLMLASDAEFPRQPQLLDEADGATFSGRRPGLQAVRRASLRDS